MRDHVRGTVMALEDPTNTTLVIVSADVYMLFGNDLAIYYNTLRAAVGESTYARLRFIVSSTHNHHVRRRSVARARTCTRRPTAAG